MSAVPEGAYNCCTNCWGKLEVLGDGDPYPILLNKQSWCVKNAKSLWYDPIWRGVNTIVSGVPGRAENPRRPDQTDHALDFGISGAVDRADALNDDEDQGLLDNIAFLRQYVIDAPTPPETSRTWRLTSPDEMTVLTANVQPPEGGQSLVATYENSGLWIGKLHIVVPQPFA